MQPQFETRLARSKAEIRAAQRLRYEVFVAELGGDGPGVDHAARLEQDAFDPFVDHLLLFDHARAHDPVVGVYRLLTSDGAAAAGRWYSADEFDLTPILRTATRPLELGRSCVHPAYRGGAGLLHLWQGLSAYVAKHAVDVLFGVASFHGTDANAIAMSLSHLHHRYLAREALRVTALGPSATAMDVIPADEIDRVAALKAIPPLLKSYLKLGGTVGQGAWIDHAFNTIDVCLILEVSAVPEAARARYQGAGL